ETGANDVLVVRGERQQLIPFVEQVVVRVDLEYGRIVVDWGLDY
ncbi:MAG: ribosome maturation factor RimM, partial [Burkholderiales bacterium]